jgi:(R,R)-butanediol dehydrogenase/meso-butanediol dehydrogenase/diacetyl reductase
MRAAVLAAPGQLCIKERPSLHPNAGEVLIRVHYVALCGSDQARFWKDAPFTDDPVVIGHEFSGQVAALGAGVKAPDIGQLVAVAPLLNCGRCSLCLRGRSNLCPQRRGFGRDVDGALQEYVAVRADRVYSLPPSVSPKEAALVEPIAVACHAVRRARTESGDNVLVLGAGAIGLLIAQVWRAQGRGPIAITDIDESRLAVAAAQGIPTWNDGPAQSAIDTLFEASGSPDAFAGWLPALAPTGQAIIVGKLEQQVGIDWVALMRKEAEIITSRYFSLADFIEAIRLLADGLVSVSPLIGSIVPFERLGEQNGRTVMSKAKQVIRLLIELQR